MPSGAPKILFQEGLEKHVLFQLNSVKKKSSSNSKMSLNYNVIKGKKFIIILVTKMDFSKEIYILFNKNTKPVEKLLK